MKRSNGIFGWPTGALLLIAVGLVMLALPAAWEGRTLLPISPGHALSVLDTLALAPLLTGINIIYYGLWQRRKQIMADWRISPGQGAILVFTAGLGIGLLLASAFSTFWWWWAVGAVLFLVALLWLVAQVTGD